MIYLKRFILGIQFLTRIPIKKNLEATEEDFTGFDIFFPVIGLIIGGFNLGIFYIINKIISKDVAVVCTVLSNIIITGGLHLDGFSDSFDGLFSSRDKHRMLEIMKDSRVGAFGAIAIIFNIILRITFLREIDYRYIFKVLLLAPILSRGMVIFISSISKYARKEGMGNFFIEKIPIKRAIAINILPLVMSYYFFKETAIVIFLSLIVLTVMLRNYHNKKIEGLTGDSLGMVNEFIEISTMFIALLILK